MRQAVNRGAVNGAGSSVGGPVRVEGAAHAHVTHDRKVSTQGAPANFEIGFPQSRRVSIGEEVLDEGLRCIANARFLPEWAIDPLERSAAAFEQAGGRARGEVVAVTIQVGLAQPELSRGTGGRRPKAASARGGGGRC